MFQISRKTAVSIAVIFAILLFYAFQPNRTQPYPTVSAPAYKSMLSPIQPGNVPPGTQIVKSLLGMEARFFNGNINYAARNLLQDPRYQALAPAEKLVDAIRFQTLQGVPYVLLMAIARNADGLPAVVPGKFDIVRQTDRGGLILKDFRGRLFYYSGYVLGTPVWKTLFPGQAIQDSFCKNPEQITFCSIQNRVNITLTKPANPYRDIPFLTLIQ